MAMKMAACIGRTAAEMDAAEALIMLRYEIRILNPAVPASNENETIKSLPSPTTSSESENHIALKNVRVYSKPQSRDVKPLADSMQTANTVIQEISEKMNALQDEVNMYKSEVIHLRMKIKELSPDEEYEVKESHKRITKHNKANTKEESDESDPEENDQDLNESENDISLPGSSTAGSSTAGSSKVPKKVLQVSNINTVSGELVPIGDGRAKVPARLLKNMNWTSHTNATRKLLTAIFPRRVLATHSLTGKPSPAFPHKPAKKKLDAGIINDIVQTVVERCNVPEKVVRTSITTKCADESKMFRTRQCNQRKKNKKNRENIPPATSDSDE